MGGRTHQPLRGGMYLEIQLFGCLRKLGGANRRSSAENLEIEKLAQPKMNLHTTSLRVKKGGKKQSNFRQREIFYSYQCFRYLSS
jgi:hypothetical protein